MTRKERAEHRKHLIYLFIIYKMGVRCFPPTIREIVDAGYCKSLSHVRTILKKMESDGMIRYYAHGHYTVVGGQWAPPVRYFTFTNEVVGFMENLLMEGE